MDGVISADGDAGGGNLAGSGSGGTIYITTDDLTGTGMIQAHGGAGEVGGGGGRVSILYGVMTLDPSDVTAAGGIGSNASGDDGSVEISIP